MMDDRVSVVVAGGGSIGSFNVENKINIPLIRSSCVLCAKIN